MSVTAKFKVNTVTRSQHWIMGNPEVQTILLIPVTGGSKENERFWAATPGGKVELAVINKEAGEFFELGEEYYIEFKKAEKPQNTQN